MSAELVKEITALAGKLRPKAARSNPGDLPARAACYAIPTMPGVVGFSHLCVWPGSLDDFRPGEMSDNLRIAAAYLILEIERLEKEPIEAAAA
jgi:hypothetical protein